MTLRERERERESEKLANADQFVWGALCWGLFRGKYFGLLAEDQLAEIKIDLQTIIIQK